MTDLLTAEQVADWLQVPKAWVYAQARQGAIPYVPLGRYRRFRREAIEAWIEAQEATPDERRKRRPT